MNFMKRRWIFLTAVAFFALTNLAHAGAVITLQGQLYSINPYDVQIKTKSSIFRVNRSALNPSQQKQIDAAGASEKTIQLTVPMTAIKQVRQLTPQASH